MSFFASEFTHTCDQCGAVKKTDESAHPKGWAFLYQDTDQKKEWCREFCETCKVAHRGVYEEYKTLMARRRKPI
jgi:hypothetical protein